MRSASATGASSKCTSLKWVSPFICRSGLTMTPGAFMSSANAVMPACFGTLGSVRASSSPRCE